jgi:hypothetical protein
MILFFSNNSLLEPIPKISANKKKTISNNLKFFTKKLEKKPVFTTNQQNNPGRKCQQINFPFSNQTFFENH